MDGHIFYFLLLNWIPHGEVSHVTKPPTWSHPHPIYSFQNGLVEGMIKKIVNCDAQGDVMLIKKLTLMRFTVVTVSLS